MSHSILGPRFSRRGREVFEVLIRFESKRLKLLKLFHFICSMSAASITQSFFLYEFESKSNLSCKKAKAKNAPSIACISKSIQKKTKSKILNRVGPYGIEQIDTFHLDRNVFLASNLFFF